MVICLLTHIPEEREAGPWLGTFLCVSLRSSGEHQVELRYTAPGLVPGAALGVVSVAGLVFLPFFFEKKKGSEKRNF